MAEPHPRRRDAHADDRVRVNRAITETHVRLIDVDGTAIGVVSIDDARRRALAASTDLVEIAPKAEPPVCRLINYTKYRYLQEKANKARRHHTPDTKEIQFGVRIGEGDLLVKLRKAKEFLQHGEPVRIVVQFKGREITHPEIADRLLARIADGLKDSGRTQHDARRDGRKISLTYQPGVQH